MVTVQSTLSAAVLRVGLARSEKKNALSLSMYEALNAAFDQAQREHEVKVLLIHGLPQVFTAGNDLEDFLKQPMDEYSPVLGFLRRLATCEKPLMAAVNGFAVGIGTTLLLHCDLVYAADDAKFALPFVNLGLCPEAGSSWLLPRLAGHAQAAEKLFFGEAFTADEALHIGLVNKVLPPAEVLPYALARAERLAQQPAASLRATKRLLKAEEQTALLARMDEEAELFRQMLTSPAAQEAMSAFLEKRKPDFSKRE
ncbi:MAG: enoyl-CoA hydratase [Burkholderiales bacterium]